jgi:phage gp29-like protein
MIPKTNARVKGLLNTRKTAILSWGWDLVPNDETQIEGAKTTKLRLTNTINTLINKYIEVVMFGYMAVKLDWQYNEDFKAISPIIENNIHAKYITPFNEYQFIEKEENNKNLIDMADPINQEFYCYHTSENIPGGVLRSIFATEIYRYNTEVEWFNYNRMLKGLIQGILKGFPDDETQAAAESSIKGVIKNNATITNEEFDIKYHTLTNSGAGTSFKDYIEMLNNAIAVAIMGQANVSEIPKYAGSKAALQVQQMITADITYSDIIQIESIINKLVNIDYQKNYNSNVTQWKFAIQVIEEVDNMANMDVISQALNIGIPLSQKEVYEKIGMSIPKDGEQLISLVQANV